MDWLLGGWEKTGGALRATRQELGVKTFSLGGVIVVDVAVKRISVVVDLNWISTTMTGQNVGLGSLRLV